MAERDVVDVMVEDKWRELTDNGKADGRVAALASYFDELATKIRARFNTPSAVLVTLDDAKYAAIRELKRSIVAGWFDRLQPPAARVPVQVKPEELLDGLEGIGQTATVELGGKRATFYVCGWAKSNNPDPALRLEPKNPYR